MQRAKLARFSGWGLLATAERGRAGAPPRGWWPSGLAPVSETGGPGLGSSLARALFARPCRGFGLLGVFSWLCHGFAARNRGAASEVGRRRADFLQFSNRLVFLRGFAQSRRHSLQRGARFFEARVLPSQRVRKASLMSAQLFAFAFPLARNFATGRLPLVPHRSLLAARHPRARLLLLANFC